MELYHWSTGHQYNLTSVRKYYARYVNRLLLKFIVNSATRNHFKVSVKNKSNEDEEDEF